jgi:hypothetical protein
MDDAWIKRPEHRAFIAAIKGLREALERERTANSDEARRFAHEEVLMWEARLEAATGFQQFETRRIVSTAAGQPAHRPPVTAKGIDAIFRRGGNLTEQRYAVTRLLVDRLGRTVGLEAARLILADMGYRLPAEDLLSDPPEGIRAPTPRQGVNPLGGAKATMRLGLMNALGYTLGREGKRDCPRAAWSGRAILHLRVATKGRGPAISPDEVARIVASAWGDIEDETKDRDPDADDDMRGDLSPRAVFRSAWRQGCADRQTGNCDKDLILQTK